MCQTVTLPLPELDPFHNTSFTARVLTSNDPDTPSVYDVGSPDTATITVQAIDRELKGGGNFRVFKSVMQRNFLLIGECVCGCELEKSCYRVFQELSADKCVVMFPLKRKRKRSGNEKI